MLREIATIARDPMRYLASVWQEYGDVVQFPIPDPPTYLVAHPEDVRTILVGAARSTTKDTIQYRSLRLVTGRGLLTADAEQWREARRAIQPAFHPDRLATVAKHTGSAADELIEGWSALPTGSIVDADQALMHLALAVVGESLFGTDLTGDAAELAQATLAALAEVVGRARMPLQPPPAIPTPANRRLRKAVARIDSAVTSVLSTREGAARPQPPDLLDLLLHPADGAAPDPRWVRDEMATFIVAGHETVASALTWAVHLLGRSREARQRLRDEADHVLGGRQRGQAVDLATISRLVFARAVLDEALRLYPPAWLITRKTTSAIKLRDSTSPDSGFLGGEIPAGSLVILSPWIVHRHPVAWTDPETFAPQRFLGSYPRTAFIPFGAGPRQCIGRDFAYAEAVLTLALLYRELDLAPTGPPPRAIPLVTIRPSGPLLARVKVRGSQPRGSMGIASPDPSAEPRSNHGHSRGDPGPDRTPAGPARAQGAPA